MMKVYIAILFVLSFSLHAQKSCRDLGRELCGQSVTMECIAKKMDKIPANCTQNISEMVAESHPCFKEMNSGKELSKSCKQYFGQTEARLKDMMKECKPLNDCQDIYAKIKDRKEADKEFQKCVEHNMENNKLSPECKKVNTLKLQQQEQS